MKKKLSKNEIEEKVISQANVENLGKIFNRLKMCRTGSREKFLQALSKIPKVEPDEEDRID